MSSNATPGWEAKAFRLSDIPKIVLPENFKKCTNILCLIDNSGSMNHDYYGQTNPIIPGKQLVANISNSEILSEASNTFCLFGNQTFCLNTLFKGFENAKKCMTFDTSTYATIIKYAFDKIGKDFDLPTKIFFCGDGNFDNHPQEENNFINIIEDAAKKGKFSQLREAYFTFAHHTTDDVIKKLSDQLKSIMAKCPNAITVVIYKLNRIGGDFQLSNLIDKRSNDTSVPSGYVDVFGLFGILPDTTATEIAMILQNDPALKKLGLLRLLRDNMLNTIRTNPQLLNTHTLYAKLHKALRIAFGDMPVEYSEIIQTILRTFPERSLEREALQTLMKSAFSDADNSEIKKILNEIGPYIRGWMLAHSKDGKTYTLDDILALVREKNTSILEFFKSGVYFKPCDGPINVENIGYIISHFAEYGMPILSPDAPKEICLLALQLMFLQTNPATITPSAVFLALMVLLSKDFILPPEIIDFIKRAVFNDEDYICKMLGLNIDNDKLVMDPLFYRNDLSRCLAHVFKLYKKELLPLSFHTQKGQGQGQVQGQDHTRFTRLQIEKFVNGLQNLHKANNLIAALTKLLKGKFTSSIEKTFLEVIGQNMSAGVNVGDIYLLPAFSKDPKLNMPSIVIVWFIEVHTGKIVLLYCEKPMDCEIATSITSVTQYLGLRDGLTPEALKMMGYTLDTLCVQKIPRGSIKLAANVDDATRKELHSILRVLDQNEIGDMALGAPLNQVVLDANIAMVRSILNPGGTRNVVRTITANLPVDILLGILGIPPMIIAALKSGSKLTMPQLIECIEQLYLCKPVIPENFVHNGDTFPISLELISEIQATFDGILSKLMGAPTTLSELSNVACMVCKEENPHKESILLPCGHSHWMCPECFSEFVRNGELPHGTPELLNTAKFCCPVERTFLRLPDFDFRVTEYYTTHPQGPPDHTVVRPCSQCDKLFEQDTGCGATEDDYETLCTRCRPQPDVDCVNLMACPGPGCPVRYLDHTACAHITCPNPKCKTHFCGKCQYVFTPEQIPVVEYKNWSCLNYCTKDNVDTKLNVNTQGNTHNHEEWPDTDDEEYYGY